MEIVFYRLLVLLGPDRSTARDYHEGNGAAVIRRAGVMQRFVNELNVRTSGISVQSIYNLLIIII